MSMRRVTVRRVFLTLISCCIFASGYSNARSDDQWQPVAKEDLLLKDNPAEPGSVAMILDRRVYADDEMRFQTEWVRIKIFKEEGTKYGDIEIPYAERYMSIDDIRARTVRQDGTVINFTGTVFDNIVAKRRGFSYQVKTFTLPGVEVGAVIEYSFRWHWKDRLPDVVRHPENYLIGAGFAVPTNTWIIQQKLFTRHALFVIRPAKNTRMEWTNVRLPHGGPSVQPDGTVKLEVADVLPIYEEEQMPPESVIDSRVHFYYVVGHLGNPWYEYGRRMEETEQRFLAVTRQLSRVVEEIAPPSEPPETRLRKIYARVQQLRYIGFEPPRTEKEAKREGLTRNNSAEDILSHGYAYSNEPNLLFIALARAAGFNASFVEVSDRRKNIFTRDVPDPSQLGASIVLVQVNGKQLFLDPATRFCPFGLLPWFESDTDGVAWGRFRGEEIRVPPQQSASAVIERVAELALTADGNLEGHAEITYGGVEALDRRLAAIAEDEAGRRKLMEEEVKRSLLPGAHVEVTSMAGWDATDEPLRIKLSVKVESYAVASERRMFFPTGIFQAARGTIPSHNRVQPVYFEHTYQTKDRVTIEIPPNYVIEALPEELTVETKFGSYKVTRSGSNGKVTMEREAELNGYYFLPETYRSVWAYLVRIRNGDAENVVLHVAHNPKR